MSSSHYHWSLLLITTLCIVFHLISYTHGTSNDVLLYDDQKPTTLNSKIEIIGYTLGDSHRSTSSSHSFFQSLDTDHDGTVHPDELASFFKLSIGGSNLDEDVEIQREVDSVMSKLDQNHNNALDIQDVFGYWNQLDTLLTVDEVAEWVVYAVQLPVDIGHVFRINHVTGYDFPELVEKDGVALQTELGIEKPAFRKRIVRLARARMLGIGSLPEAPQNITVQVEQCSAINLSWKKSEAKGFPVHSYRIQRRTVGGNTHSYYDSTPPHRYTLQSDGLEERRGGDSTICKMYPPPPRDSMSSSTAESDGVMYYSSSSSYPDSSLFKRVEDDGLDSKSRPIQSVVSESSSTSSSSSSSHASIPWIQTLSLSAPSEWQTLYVGGETQFVDTRVERGKEYHYRIQAWSSIGRSSYTVVDKIPVWKESKCHVPPSKYYPRSVDSTCPSHRTLDVTPSAVIEEDSNGKTTHGLPPLKDTRHPPPSAQHVENHPTTFETMSSTHGRFFHHLWILFHSIGWIISWIVTFSRAFLAITAFAAAAMKFRRMNVDTTTSLGDPIFPWLWKSVNHLSRKYIGKVIFPHYVTGDETLKKQSSDMYDRQINAVGLFGYKETCSGNLPKRRTKEKRSATSSQRLVPPTTTVNESSSSKAITMRRELSHNSSFSETEVLFARENNGERYSLGSTENSGSRILGRSQSSSILMNHPHLNKQTLVVDKATCTDSKDDVLQPSASTPIPTTVSHRRLFLRRKWFSFATDGHKQDIPVIMTSTIAYPTMQDSSTQKLVPMEEEDRQSTYSVQSLDPSLWDDFDQCNTCHKIYKFPFRFRHHCSRCTATFCHKHGRITHSNFISCRVPGNCVCLPCLQKESLKSIRI